MRRVSLGSVNAILYLFGALLLIMGMHSANAVEGDFAWARDMGGWGNAEVYSIKVDPAGNIYTTGAFSGTVDFDPGVGTFYFSSAGIEGEVCDEFSCWFEWVSTRDIFISKLDAKGNFVWAKQISGPGGDIGYSIAVDASGNVYTTGTFSSTVDFDHDAGAFNLTSAGENDIFVSKLDTNGNFVWAKAMGGPELDDGYSIALDASGNAYTTGRFMGTVDFDSGVDTFSITSAGGNDIFVSKLDTNGNFVWAKQIGGTGYWDIGYSIAVDASGNVYSTGEFIDTADFNPGAEIFNLTSEGSNDIFVFKLDANGNFAWAKAMGRADSDYGYSIAVDASGNVYTTGSFGDTVDFDPGDGTFNLTSATLFGNDNFVSKLDTNGNFAWAKALGETIDYRSGYSIAVDASGNAYLTGSFWGTQDFDPGEDTFFLTSTPVYVEFCDFSGCFSDWASTMDIFVSKLDASGDFVWAKAMGGTVHDHGYSIVLDASGNIYTTGSFGNTVDFDPGVGTFNLSSASVEYPDGMFVLKLSGEGEGLPQLDTSPSRDVDFGEMYVGDTDEQTIFLGNIGTGILTGNLSVSGDGFSLVEDPNFVLSARETVSYTLRFVADKKGPVSGVLSISADDGSDIQLNFHANVISVSPLGCGASEESRGISTGDLLLTLFCLLILATSFRRFNCN